jgi:hypothetical protein
MPRHPRGKLADFGLDRDGVFVRISRQRRDTVPVAIKRSLGIGRHDEVEAAQDGQPDRVVAGALVEQEPARNRRRLGCYPTEGRVPAHPLGRPPRRAAEESAVEADDDRRARLLGGVDHALK